MLERKAPSIAQTPRDSDPDAPSRILPPPEQPPPFIEPGRKDPRRIDDPPRDPDTEPPSEPAIKPPGRGVPFIETAKDPWHLLHYRALEKRQARAPHLLRVDTRRPLTFRVVACRSEGLR